MCLLTEYLVKKYSLRPFLFVTAPVFTLRLQQVPGLVTTAGLAVPLVDRPDLVE